MRLISLELHGFKSFPDTYKLLFPAGMTGVVGPNGCGKSNIGDSIAWAMGEQRPTALRVEEMSQLIFAGTTKRKAMGFAESKITVEMVDPQDPTLMKETTISRRLYRDSASEYRIDGKDCRLKDVQDLLLDTGMGTRTYSYIQQGQIDLILSSKPKDRRSLIEEAAGVTRYKLRKIEAERRLDETKLNLTRLDDIIHELNKQMGSLKRQASQAKRAASIDDEIIKIQRILFAGRYQELQNASKQSQQERDEIERKVSDLTSQVADRVSAVESLKMALDRQINSQNERGRQILALDQRLSLNDQERKFQIKFQEDSKIQRQRLDGRLEELGIRQSDVNKDIDASELGLSEAKNLLNLKEETFKFSEQTLTFASAAATKAEDEVVTLRSQVSNSQTEQLDQYRERMTAVQATLALADDLLGEILADSDLGSIKAKAQALKPSFESERSLTDALIRNTRDLPQDPTMDQKELFETTELKLKALRVKLESVRESHFKATRERDAAWAQRDALESQSLNIKKNKSELEIERTRLIHEQEDWKIKGEQAVVRVQELETETEALLIQREELHKELQDYQPILDNETQQLKDLERGAREFQEVLDNARDQRTDIVVRVTELNGLMDTLAKEIEISLRTEVTQFMATITAEEQEAWLEGELIFQTRLNELQGKRMDIGTVNVLAIEELQSSETRLIDMSTQRKDVADAIKNLELTIAEINETSKIRFKEAFEFINIKFKEVFVDLFGGGSAKLVLDETEDILECGIEITAQPPGKTPKTILSLSGGEKALTALCLLFAIFHFKPSPFCVLDEVDAALDVVNNQKFADLVKRLSQETQFIVVTHQMPTMVSCNTLYGVTHIEPGISQIVSVKLTDAEKLVQT